jgi:phage gpG-like protein
MKSLFDLINDIRAKSAAMKKLQDDFPRIIGVESVKIIKQNFKLQAYDSGTGVKLWTKRAKVTDTAYSYNRNASYRTPVLGKKSKYQNPYKGSVVNASRPLLTQTGNLRDSINYQVTGKTVIIGVFPNVPKAGAKKEAHSYAKKMNEGGSGTWSHATTHTPARQFMPRPNDGPNPKIIKAAIKKADYEISKIMAEWKK